MSCFDAMDPPLAFSSVANPHISAHVDACARGFISLAMALTNEPHFAVQIRPDTINDEFDRFKIWAGNIAAHRKGRRSLEYRLRDATHLKVETHNLLKALQDSLADGLAIVSGERTPWDEMPASDSDSDSGSETLGAVGDSNFQSDTELKQLSASIKNTVTCLFRLSMAIRDPAPNTQSRSFITVDKSYFQHHDIQHVESKFPQAARFLTERLGRAISGRRQYISYREEHHQKLVKNIEKIGQEEPRTEHTTNSTEASPIPVLDQAKTNTVMDDSFDFDSLSQTSYATSINATIRPPPLPKEAKEKEHFECPLCYMIVSIHTTAGWKQHVYRDLHPFCCTYEHCTTADRLYDSRRSWFTHELAHKSSWQCIEGCNKSFHVEIEFVAHVQAQHPELSAPNVISALKQTAVKSANILEPTECPLCEKRMTLRALQKHLGHHQEQLSLFALPPNLDDTEDDPPDDEVEVPVDVETWQDDELSDTNDIADIDDDLKYDTEPEDPSENSVAAGPIANIYKGGERPCDACRIRKIRCVIHEGSVLCVLCELHKQECTFVQSPIISTDLFGQSPVYSSPGTNSEFKELPPVPWGATPETPLGKIAGIALHFHTDLVPLATASIKDPSADESTRRVEHTKLSDRIRREVIAKLYTVQAVDEEASARRKELIKEATDLLNELKQEASGLFCQHPGCGQSFSLSHLLQQHEAHDHIMDQGDLQIDVLDGSRAITMQEGEKESHAPEEREDDDVSSKRKKVLRTINAQIEQSGGSQQQEERGETSTKPRIRLLREPSSLQDLNELSMDDSGFKTSPPAVALDKHAKLIEAHTQRLTDEQEIDQSEDEEGSLTVTRTNCYIEDSEHMIIQEDDAERLGQQPNAAELQGGAVNQIRISGDHLQKDSDGSHETAPTTLATSTDLDEPEVLFMAASLFEFNLPDDRREGGIPYLCYVPGEMFDVIGMKGELWLARNQDDITRKIGWLWEKHFARILPEDI